MKLFCFGLGYTGLALKDFLVSQGWDVQGTRRHVSLEALFFSGDRPLENFARLISPCDALLISTPPSLEGDPVFWCHQPLLKKALAPLKWIGYLSSTSIYGNHQGKWVDEDTLPSPTSSSAQNRLYAEKQWLSLYHDFGFPVHVFRLGGIYGPERNILLKLQQGTAQKIIKPGQFFSRIHLQDIVRALYASLQNPMPGSIFNVVDDEPSPPEAVIEYGARLLNIPLPPAQIFTTVQESLSPALQNFYADNKRVANNKIKTALQIEWAYPTYREGLISCLKEISLKTG